MPCKEICHDCEECAGRQAKHQNPVTRLERAQQTPFLTHDNVPIAERGKIHCGVVKGGQEIVELAQVHKQPSPDRNLEQVAAAVPRVAALVADQPALSVLDWEALEPGLRQAIISDLVSGWFMYAVLIVLVAFSVLNTQLMSVLERTREFGVMLALGMGPARLARLVGMETLLMSALGLAIGVALGALLTAYLSVAGFAYPGMEELGAKFNMPGRMYPEISFLSLLWGPLVVFLGALLAAIYPAMRLFRLAPVEAMRAV